MFEDVIVKPILNALVLLYSIVPGGDFGVAIILFTILIRTLMYPLVRSQLHQSRTMHKLQPELAKIKARAAGDKQQEASQMMDLYKRYGISPFRSILILIIQLPIFIGLYQVIQVFTLHINQLAHYTYPFVQQIPSVKAIIDTPASFNNTMLGVIDLTKTTFGNHGVDYILLLLAFISAATQYILTKQTMPQSTVKKKFRDIVAEAAEGKSTNQTDMNAAMMSGMAKFMPAMMFLIMISLPGALALYYTVSNLVAVAQQHYLLSKDTEELEIIADENPIIKVSKKTPKSSPPRKTEEAHITRIKANDTRRKKEK